MQHDDTQNPAMLWVGDGEAMWQAKAGAGGKACASCHGDARAGMRGVAARYPAFDTHSKLPVNLGQRINQCRQTRQQLQLNLSCAQCHDDHWGRRLAGSTIPQGHAGAPPYGARELVELELYLAARAKGMPMESPGVRP